MFFCNVHYQIFLQNAQAEVDVDSQHHFHNNWPETLKLLFITYLIQIRRMTMMEIATSFISLPFLEDFRYLFPVPSQNLPHWNDYVQG